MTARPLRVIRIIARLNIGGPARHVALLDAGLRDAGFETLLAFGGVGPSEGSFEELVSDARLPVYRIPGLGRRISMAGDLRALLALLRLIFQVRPDVVHTHTAKAGALGRVSTAFYNATRRKRNGCLVVHTFHGNVFSGYSGAVASCLVRVSERLMALFTDRIVVISSQQREEVGRRFGIAPLESLAIVPLGLDLDSLLTLTDGPSVIRAELGFDAANVVFGYVGRLVPIKDLPTLLHAFSLALRRAPAIRLMIAGDGESRAGLEQLAARLNVSGAVRFAGWRRDLPEVYRGLDVGVLSSRNEGTPVALIEAMAAARPVLSTAVGGVTDVVAAGVTGLLVPAGDASAMAEGMVRLANSADLRRQMGAAARSSVAQRFGRARLVADTIALYHQGLASKRASARRPS